MTQQETFKVCVFCGSSFGNKAIYAEEASKFGIALAEKKWGLVYGGGSTGLMGAVARGCATNGGYVHGVIPEALISRERTDEETLNDKLKNQLIIMMDLLLFLILVNMGKLHWLKICILEND